MTTVLTNDFLLESSVSDLQDLLQQGTITSVELVQACLAQIEKYDRHGPHLRAMVSIVDVEQLLANAERLDHERAEGRVRGPLHGIPIIIKDLINVDPKLGLPTTLGSHAFKNAMPKYTAPVIEQLVEKGLIILGKASLTELGNFKGNDMTSGWSALNGQTQSAYIEGGVKKGEPRLGETTPGGSSSGSAVGVSAGYSPISLGTEADGSVVNPAARAALYAMKPSCGSVDMSGIFTVSRTFDTVGLMAKTVLDVAVLTEHTLNDTARSKLPADGYMSYLQSGWKGVRVGVVDPRKWTLPPAVCPADPELVQETTLAIEGRISKMRNAGATVTCPVEVRHPFTFGHSLKTVLLHESREAIAAFLRDSVHTELRGVEDIIKWNEDHADIELPEDYSNQDFLEMSAHAEITKAERDQAFDSMRKVALNDTIEAALRRDEVDIIMAPMDSPIAQVAASAGAPIATVPLGTYSKNGRPFGLGLIARPGDEATLFRVMSAYESTFPGRPLPLLLLDRSFS